MNIVTVPAEPVPGAVVAVAAFVSVVELALGKPVVVDVAVATGGPSLYCLSNLLPSSYSPACSYHHSLPALSVLDATIIIVAYIIVIIIIISITSSLMMTMMTIAIMVMMQQVLLFM